MKTEVQTKTKVQLVTIDGNHHDQRLDNFLISRMKGVPKSRIYQMIRKGEVRINKSRANPKQKLCQDDVVRVPPYSVSSDDKPLQKPSQNLSQLLEKSIIYEDNALIVINKPNGIAVHGGSGVSLGLIEAMRQIRSQEKFLELVHRLDRDTSGLLMIAKKRSMLLHLHKALREGKLHKHYTAIVSGKWPQRCFQVTASLLKQHYPNGERYVVADDSGKPAKTVVRVLESLGQDATLIEASPKTGRTHQIRVHCLVSGCPIIGDSKYNKLDCAAHKAAKRLFLHASRLTIPLPATQDLHLESKLPDEFINFISNHT